MEDWYPPHGIRHDRSQDLIDAAWAFACGAHFGQYRKYTGKPYITHPIAVARIVASVTDDCNAICAALLHDTVEDCEVTYEELLKQEHGFGYPIANLVMELTDVSKPENGNRKYRKAMDREHTAQASPLGQTVKLADLIHNSESILEYDKDFAVVYMKEKALLLPFLEQGDRSLVRRAEAIVDTYYKERRIK